MFLLSSCYASGNLGVIQKINDADMIVDGIGKVIKNIKDWNIWEIYTDATIRWFHLMHLQLLELVV